MSLIVPETTTKFTKRSLAMYKLIAERCASFSNLINGNILVFFPSYQVMNEVFNFYREIGNKTLFVEKQGISKEEKEELLKKFKSYKVNGAVLFAVSGASFSEGIDLPGDLLKAVIIVGLPLSQPDLEAKELIRFYDEKFSESQKGKEIKTCPAGPRQSFWYGVSAAVSRLSQPPTHLCSAN